MLSRFVASAAHPREPIVDDPATIEDVRCVVRLRGSHGDRELIVGTELGGGVRVFGSRADLPHRASTQLAFHEVAAAGRVLELDADELFLFDLQTLEMLPDAPGPNDALYVYGALRGPYPRMLATSIVAVDGQLTVTRSDLLAGLVEGVANAFAYAPDVHGSRCVHALLPGERASEIERGRGIVLALPLVPGWMLDSAVPNDQVAAQILYDVLFALRSDLGIDANAPPLPVPNRRAHEKKLVEAGWRIDGNEAVRSKGTNLLKTIFGREDRRPLPRQATLDELVAEARAVLGKLGAPTPETTALSRRMNRTAPSAQTVTRDLPTVPRDVPTVERTSVPVLPTPHDAPRPHVKTDSTEWMKDFVDAHRSSSTRAPRVSVPARAVATTAAPSWMADFADGMADDRATDDDRGREGDKPSAPARPDWSKDFD